MTKYTKAITAVVIGLLAVGLKYLGLTPDSTVTDVVSALVTAGLVYLVRNKK